MFIVQQVKTKKEANVIVVCSCTHDTRTMTYLKFICTNYTRNYLTEELVWVVFVNPLMKTKEVA